MVETRNEGEWFAQKTFGYGAGLPIAWQGWVLLAGYIALLSLASLTLLPRHWSIWAAILTILTIGFSVIAAQHTQGGWRWRWGK